ncbi:uncharacterized protein [Phyllobates terribilis]|uniref:uncharacterized protein isoform X2 n=1 Tax=Phyllobates terribilis TaxID=111132 RepID=UPI003CCB05EF
MSSTTFAFNQEEASGILARVTTPGTFLHTPIEEVRTRDLEKELRRYTALDLHSITLAEYHKSQRIPRGLRVNLRPTLFSENSDYCTKFEGILNKCSMDIILLTIDFIQKEITDLQTRIASTEEQLSHTISAEEFTTLKNKVDKTVSEYRNELQLRKKSKFLRDAEDYLNNQVYRWRFSVQGRNSRPYRRGYNSSPGRNSSTDSEKGTYTPNYFLDQRRNRPPRIRRGGGGDRQGDSTRMTTRSQMCGCAVSPQKLSFYMRQERSSFVEPGRVQLYEFLDLLEICESRKKFSILEERVPSTDKAGRGLYQMDDMRTLMLTPDEKLARHLNRRFQHVDSWMLPQDTKATSSPLSRICQQTESHNGTRPPPPQRRIESCNEGVTDEAWTLITPVPQLRCICYTPRREKPILTEQDIQTTKNNIEELLYKMETLGERTRWDLNWKLDYYLPGYRERSASRHIRVDPQPPKLIKKKYCKDDVFKRLSAPRKRLKVFFHPLKYPGTLFHKRLILADPIVTAI